jgi:putative phage-type endonuclease
MPDLIPTGTEEEWLAARRPGITASEIAIVMGLSPYSSPYALFHQKLGILPAGEDQAVFERGRVLEPYVAEKFAAAHPEFYVYGDGRELYAHCDRPWQLATPDRLLFGPYDGRGWEETEPSAVLETKTDAGSDEWGEPGTDEIPVHYRCQVLWQMDVMGVSRAYVSCLDPARWQIREYVIGHHPSHAGHLAVLRPGDDLTCDICVDIVAMRGAGDAFMVMLAEETVPDVDWRPATIGALKKLHPSLTDEDAVIGLQLRERYRAACRNHKHWEQRKKLYEAQLRERMGSARRAVSESGVPVARRDVYEVGESARKAYTVDKLVAVPPKKEKKP